MADETIDTPTEEATTATEGTTHTEDTAETTANKASGASAAFFEQAQKIAGQATDKAKAYAEDGKARAGGALDEFSRLMTEAAGSVDEKLGAQYGQYARTAADQVSAFSETLKNKEVDELIEDARTFVRKSPAIAIGTAAALGFVLARVIKSGIETPGKS